MLRSAPKSFSTLFVIMLVTAPAKFSQSVVDQVPPPPLKRPHRAASPGTPWRTTSVSVVQRAKAFSLESAPLL
jgi:hypothetical protein